MRKFTICLVSIATVLMFSVNAKPAPLYSWQPAPMVYDPPNDLISGPYKAARDILGVWYVHDSGFHYFRMDLAGAPSPNQSQQNFAGSYGLAINIAANGSLGTENFTHVPNLVGIDYFLDAHFDPGMGGFGFQHLHKYNNATNLLIVPPSFIAPFYGVVVPNSAFQYSENGGKTLEWKIPDSAFGFDGVHDVFSFYGYTVDYGSEFATYDLTLFNNFPVIPEPATIISMILPLFWVIRKRLSK